MENRIEKRMRELQENGQKAFITYMTAGLPDMEGTKALIRARRKRASTSLSWGFHFQILRLTAL